MSTVIFRQGSAFTKKRKRMKGTDSTKKVEIKQWNPRYIGEGDTYNGIAITNVMNPGNDSVAAGSSWMPYKIYMPEMGTDSHQRIGKSIFLKYLRFKGFIRVYPRSLIGSRWRLRLIRCDNFSFPDSHGGHGVDAIRSYVDILKNSKIPDYTVASDVWLACAHNFYKSLKNVDNNNVVQYKVIASGYIPASNPYMVNFQRALAQGSASEFIETNGRVYEYDFGNGCYCIPLDVKVKCNDFIKDDINYYYCFEVDCGVGFNMSKVQIQPPATDCVPSTSIAHAMYEVSFFIRGYFTDI